MHDTLREEKGSTETAMHALKQSAVLMHEPLHDSRRCNELLQP